MVECSKCLKLDQYFDKNDFLQINHAEVILYITGRISSSIEPHFPAHKHIK
jgi:hypothetical protein